MFVCFVQQKRRKVAFRPFFLTFSGHNRRAACSRGLGRSKVKNRLASVFSENKNKHTAVHPPPLSSALKPPPMLLNAPCGEPPLWPLLPYRSGVIDLWLYRVRDDPADAAALAPMFDGPLLLVLLPPQYRPPCEGAPLP